MKTEYTPEEQLVNLDEAEKHWNTVSEDEIVGDLCIYGRCGSTACFGGHLTQAKYFRDLGLQTTHDVYWNEMLTPVLVVGPDKFLDTIEASKVAEVFFGDQSLFNAVTFTEHGNINKGVSLHQIVLDRITNRRNQIIKELSK